MNENDKLASELQILKTSIDGLVDQFFTRPRPLTAVEIMMQASYDAHLAIVNAEIRRREKALLN